MRAKTQKGFLHVITCRTVNAYTVYILHPLIIVGLAYGLHTVTLYPLLKYGIAVMIAVPCCFALSALVCMIPYAKKIL
jgi:surface polysaccharide O-acyltransferase-like enzyme